MFRQLNFWKWVIHRIYTGGSYTYTYTYIYIYIYIAFGGSYTGYIQTYTGYTGIQDTQDLYRLISDVDVSSTRTVLREKYVRMPSVWRDAGRDGDN